MNCPTRFLGFAGVLLAFFLLLMGCQRETAPIKVEENLLPSELAPFQKELVKGNTEFALALYQRLAEKEGNIVFSPFSISTALAMTYAGARGQTADEMAGVLRFTLPQEKLPAVFGGVIANLQREASATDSRKVPLYDLQIANGLWGQKGYSFRPQFLDVTQRFYRAEVAEVDFHDKERARQIINHWVAEKTHKRITEILDDSDLTSQTRVILAALSEKTQHQATSCSSRRSRLRNCGVSRRTP